MKGVADSSPLHYLVQIKAEDVLRQLFVELITPPEVIAELTHPRPPPDRPSWRGGIESRDVSATTGEPILCHVAPAFVNYGSWIQTFFIASRSIQGNGAENLASVGFGSPCLTCSSILPPA